MASRILNITRGYHMSTQRASKGIAECSFAWVESGVSVRNLTLAESVAARAVQTKVYDPLPYSEIPGLRFSGSTDYALVADAHKFCEVIQDMDTPELRRAYSEGILPSARLMPIQQIGVEEFRAEAVQ